MAQSLGTLADLSEVPEIPCWLTTIYNGGTLYIIDKIFFKKHCNVCVCVNVCDHICASCCVEVRGQFEKAGSLLPCDPGLNSGCQA